MEVDWRLISERIELKATTDLRKLIFCSCTSGENTRKDQKTTRLDKHETIKLDQKFDFFRCCFFWYIWWRGTGGDWNGWVYSKITNEFSRFSCKFCTFLLLFSPKKSPQDINSIEFIHDSVENSLLRILND